MIKETNKRFFVTISKRLYKSLEEVAASDSRSVSNYVLKLIKDDIKSKGK